MPETTRQRYFRRFDFREALLLALLGAVIVAIKILIRIPLKIPGHSTVFWVFFLILGKGLVPRFGSGMIMGFFSGILAFFTGMGKQGPFVFFKFFFPGLTLDVLAAPILRLRRGGGALSNPWMSSILGMLVNLAKLGTNLALFRVLELPLERVETVIGTAVIAHVCFGLLGGLAAALVLRRLSQLLPPL